ncbi:MAG TPA: AlpA family phage regulatory protein [Burkholderiaceae bacterium]
MSSVIKFTGLGRSTIYRLIAEQRFPRPVQLSQRAVGWRRVDLDCWSAGRPPCPHRVSDRQMPASAGCYNIPVPAAPTPSRGKSQRTGRESPVGRQGRRQA